MGGAGHDLTRLFQECRVADRLQARIKKGSNKTKRRRRRRAWLRKLARIRNKVDEVDKKLSTWLCKNHRVVLIPKFETQRMVERRGTRKLNSPDGARDVLVGALSVPAAVDGESRSLPVVHGDRVR